MDVHLFGDLLETSSELKFGLLVAPGFLKVRCRAPTGINQVVVGHSRVLYHTGGAHSHSLSYTNCMSSLIKILFGEF